MFCKVFFFNKNNDWKNIISHLDKISVDYQIITSNFVLHNHLLRNGKKSVTLQEIFPDNAPQLWRVNKNSRDKLENYKKLFREFSFHGFELFTSIENQIRNELIFLQKMKEILEKKTSTIFILQGFSYSYFNVIQIANQLGYEVPYVLYQIQGSQIKNVSPEIKIPFMDLKEKLRKTSKSYKILNVASFSFNIAMYKIFPKQSFWYKKIFSKVENKLRKLDSKLDSNCTFFLTSKRNDVLNGIIPIVEKLEQKQTKVALLTFDLITASLLDSKRISFVNLFEEAYVLAELIKKSKEGHELIKKFRNIVLNTNLELVNIKGFNNYLLQEIFRSVAIMTICEYLFNKLKLNSIVIFDDVTRNGNAVISTSKKFKIPTFIVPVLLIDTNPIGIDVYHSDKICIYGKQGLDSLISLGYKKEQIIVTGNPKYDSLKKLKTLESKKFLENNCEIDSSKKLVAVAMSRWHENDEIWITDFIKFCNKKNFEFIIKVHPMYKREMNDLHEHKVKFIKNSCKSLKYTISFDLDLSRVLSAADLVITDYSNTGVEACLLQKPIITVNFIKENLDNQQKFFEFGASLYVENYKEFEKLVTEVLIESKHFEDLKIGWNKIVELYNYNNDGKAAQRIADVL